MSTSTQVSNLKINKLTKQQYQGITPSNTELYFLTDDSGITSTDVVNALGYTPVATTGVGNGTITFVQDGVTKGTITTNQSTDATITIDAGGTSVTVDQTYSPSSTNPQSGTAVASANFQTIANKVTTISSSSTDTEYPSAKCVYDAIENSKPSITVTSDTDGSVIVGTTGVTVSDDSSGNVFIN